MTRLPQNLLLTQVFCYLATQSLSTRWKISEYIARPYYILRYLFYYNEKVNTKFSEYSMNPMLREARSTPYIGSVPEGTKILSYIFHPSIWFSDINKKHLADIFQGNCTSSVENLPVGILHIILSVSLYTCVLFKYFR